MGCPDGLGVPGALGTGWQQEEGREGEDGVGMSVRVLSRFPDDEQLRERFTAD